MEANVRRLWDSSRAHSREGLGQEVEGARFIDQHWASGFF